MISKEEWVRLTQRLHGSTATLFNPKENQTIQDFIETAKDDVEKVQEEKKP